MQSQTRSNEAASHSRGSSYQGQMHIQINRENESYKVYNNSSSVGSDSQSHVQPHFRGRSLGSIEEESPRWTNPPEPESIPTHDVNTGRTSDKEKIVLFGGSNEDAGEPYGSQTGSIKMQGNHSLHQRHAQSQPSLLKTTDSRRAILINQAYGANSSSTSSLQQRQSELSSKEAPRAQHKPSAQEFVMTTENSKQVLNQAASYSQGAGSEPFPAYVETQRDASSRSGKLFEAFAERLYTREKVSQISMELKELEELIFCRMAKEVPELYRQLSIEHYEKRSMGKIGLGRTHRDVVEGTLLQAQELRETFRNYETRRTEMSCFNEKIVDGIQMDVHEAILGGKALNTMQRPNRNQLMVEKQSASSFGVEDYMSVKNCLRANNDSYESTIQAIKMGGSVAQLSSGTIHAPQDSNESFMVQIMRQQEQEISKCNALISELRGEGADLEQTIVEQRQEIQNLVNQLKQQTLRFEDKEKQSFERREMDNLVRRLKEELRQTQEENSHNRVGLNESKDLIQSLHGQVATLKHRINVMDGASKSQLGLEYAAQLTEMVDLRQQNVQIQGQYHELAENFHGKQLELVEMEEKSKQMLIAAQRDAQECIKYFKDLAYQAQATSENHDRPRNHSHSPVLKKRADSKTNQPKLQPTVAASKNTFLKEAMREKGMPLNLGPVQLRQKPSRRPCNDRGEYNVNGVKLRMNQRSAGTLDSNGGQVTSKRAQTLSPSNSSARRTNTRNKMTDEIPYDRNESTLSAHDEQFALLKHTTINSANQRVASAELQLDCLLEHLGEAFSEICEQKRSVSEMISAYGEQYCQQLQKFSVLAYDYLERIENLAKRDIKIDEEIAIQSDVVAQLKIVAARQAEHIKAQNELITAQKNQLTLQGMGIERTSEKNVSSFTKIGQLVTDELPQLRDTILISQSTIFKQKRCVEQDKTELDSTKHLLDLGKKKVRILEEELEKSLESSQAQEETIIVMRKKFLQLIDLIKDIWQGEVQNATINPVMSQSITSVGASHYRNGGGNTDQNMSHFYDHGRAHVIDIPMPISWLSDINDHIKQLKEMNDFQMDEVFRIVNMLHLRKQDQDDDGQSRCRDNSQYSNSTSEEEADNRSGSLISEQRMRTYVPVEQRNTTLANEQKDLLSNRDHRHRRSAPSQSAMLDQEVNELSETERTLEQYDEQARMMRQQSAEGLASRRIGDCDDDLYVHTTSLSRSKEQRNTLADRASQKQLSSCSPEQQEVSFSQCLEETAGHHHQQQEQSHPPYRHSERVGNRAVTYRRDGWTKESREQKPVSLTGGRKRDRSHQPSRNLEWPELGAAIVGPEQRSGRSKLGGGKYGRRSQNPTSNRYCEGAGSLSFSDKRREGQSTRRRHRMMNSGIYAGHQGYRTSIDMSATCGTNAMDGAKRNELYIMLREEVENHLRQTEVSKETVLNMKRRLRQKRKELFSTDQANRMLGDERQSLIEANEHMEGEMKELELQLEELQGVVQDREASMDTLKAQIEDFEKELLGLQDQMTHVMKLNAEIGAASEHWQLSYRQLQDDAGREKSQLIEDFNKNVSKKIEKIQQFKRKLQEKENTLGSLKGALNEAATYRDEVETRRLQNPAVAIQTEPTLELMEQHKAMLENKLGQVKQDVNTVLDQVDREQKEKGQMHDRLLEQKETNKSLVAELNVTMKDLAEVQGLTTALQRDVRSKDDELRRMTEALQIDQDHYQEEIQQAEKINAKLQQQVEQVTRAAEELQEHYNVDENLQRNMEIQEQKIGQLDEQLIYLQGKIDQKDTHIAGLENSILCSGSSKDASKPKRESRSVSLPRSCAKIQSSNHPSPTKVDKQGDVQGNNMSQMLPRARGNDYRYAHNISSVSRSSFILSRETKIEPGRDEDHFCQVDELNNTLQTNQSMFDEHMMTTTKNADDSATFSRAPHNQQNQRTNMSMSRKHRPPKTQQQSHQQTSVTHQWRNAVNTTQDGGNSRQETSAGMLEHSPYHKLAKNQTAVSTMMGTSQQVIGCCCGTAQCARERQDSQAALQGHNQKNSSDANRHCRALSKTGGFGKQTAIDDLSSGYQHFKAKQEANRDSKKKFRKALQMTEVLVKHYLNKAMSRADRSKNVNSELIQQMNEWEAEMACQRQVGEDKVSEAQAFFRKRNSNVISCLKALAEHVGPPEQSNTYVTEATHSIDYQSNEMTVAKPYEDHEPPQIVSGRRYQSQVNPFNECSDEAQMDTDMSEPQIEEVFSEQTAELNQKQHMQLQPKQYSIETTSVLSPSSIVCRNCTAMFQEHQISSITQQQQYKVLFSKFMQTGRSLAGICYGGAMFMGENQLKAAEKKTVDFALSFLARDSSDFDSNAQPDLNELWGVFDGLLTCLSKIVSGACQGFLRANAAQVPDADRREKSQQEKEAYDSIHQKSLELSIDQNHQISRLDRGSFNDLESVNQQQQMTLDQHQISQALQARDHAISLFTTSSQQQQQVGPKMLELEQRIRNKFTNIRTLEALLDNILGGKRADVQAILPQLIGDLVGMKKVFLNLRRAVSKLKIDLHQDYLHLSQINLHFQVTSSSQQSGSVKIDPNASISMNNTIEQMNVSQHQHQFQQQAQILNQQQAHQPVTTFTQQLRSSSNQLQQVQHQQQQNLGTTNSRNQQNHQRQRDSSSMADSIGSARQMSPHAISSFASMPQLAEQHYQFNQYQQQQQIQIGSGILTGMNDAGRPPAGAVSAREPISPGNSGPMLIVGNLAQQSQLSSGTGIPPPYQQRPRIYYQNSSVGQNMPPSSTVNMASQLQPFAQHSARLSTSNSGATSIYQNVNKTSHIDRIVEELQGITTYELSQGDTPNAERRQMSMSSQQFINRQL